MSDRPQIFGIPTSTFCWTIRLVCAEKGQAHDFVEMIPGGVLDGVRHPFARVPVLRFRGVTVYESPAIARFLDRELEGPALQPRDSLALARMDQWISATADYLYDSMIEGVVSERLIAPLDGREPDEAVVAEQAEIMHGQLGVVDEMLCAERYLAGPDITLADLFLAPVIYWVDKTPEGASALDAYPTLRRWFRGIAERPAFRETTPLVTV
ncbi:glutathione S-transferase family protein [Zavarzinia compransoris]|uniref:glutathione S-transferase family protein n=1 Tax=Zavarzinia marina TaxID=2911065 RepID=UPI001F2551EE|nr:glutathione S-transferase family protein [Zavarzinia marina]MCF4164979.1 glutathione S-transferase family protein [Zavarzinia marina]